MAEPHGTIGIVSPGSPTHGGNAVTAERWEAHLEALGWRVFRAESWDGRPCDALVALHARKSHDSVLRFRRAHPRAPLIVVGTGTDLYTDVPDDGEVRESLGLASRVIVLQTLGMEAVPPELRERTRMIHQSIERMPDRPEKANDAFEVCVVAHLRPVKDPLLTARAARLLPEDSRVRVVHVGGVIDPQLGEAAEEEAAVNPRYRWLGERSRDETLAVLARCRLFSTTSRHEGGANAVSEALAHDVPVVATRIPGALGLLGEDYPGTFPVGDEAALAELLHRAETDAGFLADMEQACRARAWITEPEREREAIRQLLAELRADAPASGGGG